MSDLTFLHTAPVHVQGFDALLRDLAPETRARHLVRSELLDEARALGVEHADVAAHVAQAIEEAAVRARVVLCTCSTIGGLAERAGAAGGFPVLRIDRAMAEEAVARGRRILVAATLESTLGPTEELILQVAKEKAVEVELRRLVVVAAWPLFERADLEGYHDCIARALADVREADSVVLAQASMADAAARCPELRIPVLSSPRLGLQRALETLAAA